MSTLGDLLAALDTDRRHDLLQLHEADGQLTGVAEPRFADDVSRIAAELGLEESVMFALSEPVVATRRAAILDRPLPAASQLNEVLLGDELLRLDRRDGHSLIRTLSDDYLGWVPDSAVVAGGYSPTHTVTALRAHAFAGPRVQSQRMLELSWGERLRVVSDLAGWLMVKLPDGRDAFVDASAMVEGTPDPIDDFVAAARSLLHAPYVWGGNTAWGLDCSGLAQLIHAMAGNQLPRDADEQFSAGQPIDLADAQPGDAACFRGHIGIIVGPERMVHSTARGMRVREEPVFAVQGLRDIYLGTVRFGPRSGATPEQFLKVLRETPLTGDWEADMKDIAADHDTEDSSPGSP